MFYSGTIPAKSSLLSKLCQLSSLLAQEDHIKVLASYFGWSRLLKTILVIVYVLRIVTYYPGSCHNEQHISVSSFA